jgi:hypothetical protein
VTLQAVYDYFRHYDKKTFLVVACQGNEPSEEDVAAFERTVGFPLPDEFRTFTRSPLGGLYIEVREELWPRPKLYEVGPFWSFLYAIKVFGIAKGIPDWLDIRVQFERFRAESSGACVPFLQLQGDADLFCFDRAGKIVQWDHETGEFTPIGLSFPELLMRELRELEERKDRKLRGEHKK